METLTFLTWLGVAACLLHSAVFSGLNLALFGLDRLQLEVESKAGSRAAGKVLALRRDSNFLLTTILWGNVGVNTLLTLLSDSLMTGVAAFTFSTVGITIVGEILPQSYFSRNALKMGAALSPVIRLYQKLLYPVAKPTALLLDVWLGKEGVTYFREQHLREVIERHMHADEADLHHREGQGILNYLHLDDLPVSSEGEPVNPDSVIALPVRVDLPVIPEFACDPDDAFVQRVLASGHKWVILTDEATGRPGLVLDADAFARAVFRSDGPHDAYRDCHRPVVVEDADLPVGAIIKELFVEPEHAEDDVIDRDLILVWTAEHQRVITGADLLGRLLRGIVPQRGEASDGPGGGGA